MKTVKLARVLASSAAMVALSATVARADFKDFPNSCSAGAIKACASLQITTTINGSGGTNVVILVRNVQGSNGIDNTLGSIITRIGLVAPPITGATGLVVTGISGAGIIGTNPGALWSLATPGRLGGTIELAAGTAGLPGGIIGCNAPLGGTPASAFQTCGGGWVQFSFTTTNPWSANNAELAWLTGNIAAGGNGFECDTQTGSGGRSYCAITPEPVSMLLMASGLTGMGGFGFLRRRKGQDTPKV